jgi:hypothetical protein
VMSTVNGPPSSNPKVEPVALEEPVAVAPVLEPPVTSVAATQVSPKEEKKRKRHVRMQTGVAIAVIAESKEGQADWMHAAPTELYAAALGQVHESSPLSENVLRKHEEREYGFFPRTTYARSVARVHPPALLATLPQDSRQRVPAMGGGDEVVPVVEAEVTVMVSNEVTVPEELVVSVVMMDSDGVMVVDEVRVFVFVVFVEVAFFDEVAVFKRMTSPCAQTATVKARRANRTLDCISDF